MNKEELKELVKRYFKLTEETITPDTTVEEANEKFANAKLIDGTEVTNMVDAEFEVGQVLHVITEEGEHVIAPSGEHELESGIVVTVNGEGVITGIKRPDEEGQGSLAEEDLPVASVDSVEMEEVEVEIGEVPSLEEAIVSAISEIVAPEIEAMKLKLAEIEEAMKEHMSKPAQAPTLESKFNKIQDIKKADSKGLPSFDTKKAQMDLILKAKTTKLSKNA